MPQRPTHKRQGGRIAKNLEKTGGTCAPPDRRGIGWYTATENGGYAMIREWNIWVVGGDQRQACLAGLLALLYRQHVYGVQKKEA